MDRGIKGCVVAVGYSRPDSMQRLLSSVLAADYGADTVDLFVSIDKGPRQEGVRLVAELAEWPYGEKNVRVLPEKLGLRPHILSCGDLTAEYDFIVVLEDDLSVAPGFYRYARQTVEKYGHDDGVGQISLYSHRVNVLASRLFEPEWNGYDAFTMQFAQSWGQCWTRPMWFAFRQWYDRDGRQCFESGGAPAGMPRGIASWDDHSWLKYYNAYLLDSGRTVVYPYVSLTTNHSEVGQHSAATVQDYQVPMGSGCLPYRLPSLKEAVRYDMFFERMGIGVGGYDGIETTMDLYGKKDAFGERGVLVSTAARPFRVLERFALAYHPHEVNCRLKAPGNEVVVYDLSIPAEPPQVRGDRARTRYDVRATPWRSLLSLGFGEFADALKTKIVSATKTK